MPSYHNERKSNKEIRRLYCVHTQFQIPISQRKSNKEIRRLDYCVQGRHGRFLAGKTPTVAAKSLARCRLFRKIKARLRSCQSYLSWRLCAYMQCGPQGHQKTFRILLEIENQKQFPQFLIKSSLVA